MTAVYGLVKQGSGTRHQEITGNVVFATVLPVLLQKYTAAAELLPSQRPLRVGLANGSPGRLEETYAARKNCYPTFTTPVRWLKIYAA